MKNFTFLPSIEFNTINTDNEESKHLFDVNDGINFEQFKNYVNIELRITTIIQNIYSFQAIKFRKCS